MFTVYEHSFCYSNVPTIHTGKHICYAEDLRHVVRHLRQLMVYIFLDVLAMKELAWHKSEKMLFT